MLPTNPRSVRETKLREEVEAMEAEAQKDQTIDPTQSTKVKEEESSSEVAEVITGQEVKVKETEPEKNLPYWKDRCLEYENRFKVSKAKYDSNIFKLKQDNLSLRNVNIEVKKRLNVALQAQAASEPDKLDEVFTKEQVDVLGQETVDVLKDEFARTNKRVEDAEAKVDADKLEQEEKDLKSDYEAEWNNFTSRLKKLVPDIVKLNTDKGFLAWLKEPDELTGEIREDILAKAEEARLVGPIVQMFKGYKPVKVANTQDSVSKRIAPANKEGSDTVSNIQPNDTMTMAEVDKFYDEVGRGKYKGKYTEKKAMEAKIDKAWAAGKIT